MMRELSFDEVPVVGGGNAGNLVIKLIDWLGRAEVSLKVIKELDNLVANKAGNPDYTDAASIMARNGLDKMSDDFIAQQINNGTYGGSNAGGFTMYQPTIEGQPQRTGNWFSL